MTTRRAFVISGVPGAGKTTIARLLASRLDRAAHIEGDLLHHGFIVSGAVAPQEEPRREAERQLELRRRNIRLLAESFLEAGFVPVIDDVVISPSVLRLYRDLGRTVPVVFIQLAPSVEVVRARDAARHKHVFDLWGHLDAEMRANMPRVGVWLDTSQMTPHDTVDAILRRADAGLLDPEVD